MSFTGSDIFGVGFSELPPPGCIRPDLKPNVCILHAGDLRENILVAPQERTKDYAMFLSAESY
jgi:hypothetical protein